VSSLTVSRQGQQALSLDVLTGRNPEPDEEAINFLDYWRILVKRKWTVLATLGMVLVIGLVNTLLTTPIYRSTATLQLERTSLQVVQEGGVNSPNEFGQGDEFQRTQIELLRSRALSERVVSKLGLLESGELDRLWPSSTLDTLRRLFGGGSATPPPAQATKPAKTSASDERMANTAASFRTGLSVEPINGSQLVKVNYDSPDPLFSQRAANAIAEAFEAQNLERKFDSNSYAKGYLEDRLAELKTKLEDSEKKLVEFASKESIVSTGDESGGNLTTANLASLNTAYAKAKEDRIRAEARWRQAPNLRGGGLQGQGGDQPMIQSLQESRAKLQMDYQDKLRLYKPDYPVMQQLKGQIDEVTKQIAAEEGNIRSGIQAEYQSALQQEQMLAAQLDTQKADVLDLQNRSIQYNIFKREVDTNRQLYDALLQRYKEIGVAGTVGISNIAVVEAAQVPDSPSSPNLLINLLLAGLAGVLIAGGLTIALEQIDEGIRSAGQVQPRLGLPLLGTAPDVEEDVRAQLMDTKSELYEAYFSIRSNLAFTTNHGFPRALAVTSTRAAEGKSSTSFALAAILARLGKRVLLLDGDMRSPTVQDVLGLPNEQGLSNYLAGDDNWHSLVRSTQQKNFYAMTSGPIPPSAAELLSGDRMDGLIRALLEEFDHVVVDSPPILGLTDAPIISRAVEGCVLVVEAGGAAVRGIRASIERMRMVGGHIFGVVLTKVPKQTEGYGYGYGYGFDYGKKESSTPAEAVEA
jgi:capsular exopolysaccharide synthesis family protein